MTLSAHPDVQAAPPAVGLALSRVGVTGVEKVVRVRDELFSARLECFVDLGPAQKGAHMSRFEETVNEAMREVVLGGRAFRAEDLAERIAVRVRERQDAVRAEVTIAARYPEHKPAPVSGVPTQELYTLLGSAVASERGTRRLVGVRAQGMTACPCAQGLVAAASRERLLADGFSEDEVGRILEHVPVATHNQRGIGTLQVGLAEGAGDVELDARVLLGIVEDAMSSEVYELMKRSDEAAVVEKAHRRPRFVEDCVREMLAGVARLDELGDEVFVTARQENLETIHQHDVVAERQGLLGAVRAEIGGAPPLGRQLSVREWLDGAA